jgi:chromosome partitioning protein
VQVVAFLSASGGVGKTTIAAHIAHKFLSEGKKVLLIDLDPSAGLSTALLGEAGVAQLEEKGELSAMRFLSFCVEKVLSWWTTSPRLSWASTEST